MIGAKEGRASLGLVRCRVRSGAALTLPKRGGRDVFDGLPDMC